MGQAITYYIVNEKKISFPEFDSLTPKPELPQIKNFKSLKDFVEQNTSENKESAIIIDTDNGHILLELK